MLPVQGGSHDLPIIDHDMLPVQVHKDIMLESTVSDAITSETIERSITPPPPSSSPPPLSPAKGDNSSSNDHDDEEWREVQLKNSPQDDVDNESSSSLDTDQWSGADDLLDEIDQYANHSNLSAIVAKGMNDSLGTLSNLSEETTPPPPLSSPPDL